jgi:hypothetical protein
LKRNHFVPSEKNDFLPGPKKTPDANATVTATLATEIRRNQTRLPILDFLGPDREISKKACKGIVAYFCA